MKKYTKPMIVFESFTLSTNIAGDCEEKIKTFSEGECAYKVQFGKTEVSFFTSEINACGTTEVSNNTGLLFDGLQYNGFCYHVPEESYNLFNS